MTERTPDRLSAHPDTLLLGWLAKLLSDSFHLWDGITVNFLIRGGLTTRSWEAPDTQSSEGQQRSSWHCYLSSGCFLHSPLPSGQGKLRWQSFLRAPTQLQTLAHRAHTDGGALLSVTAPKEMDDTRHGVVWAEFNTGAIYTGGTGAGAHNVQHRTPGKWVSTHHPVPPDQRENWVDRASLAGATTFREGHAASPNALRRGINSWLHSPLSVWYLQYSQFSKPNWNQGKTVHRGQPMGPSGSSVDRSKQMEDTSTLHPARQIQATGLSTLICPVPSLCHHSTSPDTVRTGYCIRCWTADPSNSEPGRHKTTLTGIDQAI